MNKQIHYAHHNHNRMKKDQTSTAEAYPQKWFKDKPCRECAKTFTPTAPSERYCSDACKGRGITTAYLKRNYNITLDCYEKLLEKQNHLCAICHTEGFVMSAAKNGHVNKLVVDHCHESGRVRGLLCHNCNRALGLLKDNTETIQRALDYLNV